MKQADVIKAVAESLKVNPSSVTLSSSADKISEWDSLGHIAILSQLDKQTGGKAASIKELASAYSVAKLIESLRKHQLIDD